MKPIQQEQLSCRVNANALLLDQFDKLTLLNKQKNELLGMAAHDIRGPLGIILSGCSMLKKEKLSENGRMLVDLASEAADSMEELLDGLLDLSAIENASISINKEKLNLGALLEKTVESMQLFAKDKGQKLFLDPVMDPVWLKVDSTRIKEVFQNLISNAIKYSSKEGYIEVCLSSNHKRIRVEVIDEAGGVPVKEQHLLFQAFSKISTNPTEGERSTGLGLSICRKIMELHGGEIKYRPNGRVGSIFEVNLPG